MNRRTFMLSSIFSTNLAAFANSQNNIRLGLIADLHHDLMPDGMLRMQTFEKAMSGFKPDAILQLGDFAYPNTKNQSVIHLINKLAPKTLHVLGNHDTDAKHTFEQCKSVWGLRANYYSEMISGIKIIVLDGNQKGSPTYKGGYPSYIGKNQLEWLQQELKSSTAPVLICSHQPLAGPGAVDDAIVVQDLLGQFQAKILLCISGHTHIDYLMRIQNVSYWHVNSASYYWVGSKAAHISFSPAIHGQYPALVNTCPYQNALYATLEVDLREQKLIIQGAQSNWVGKSPWQAGAELPMQLTDGEEVAPRIRDRQIYRPK